MKKKAFRGWKHIFDFTLKQAFEAKGFKGLTILLALVLLIGGMAISTIMAYSQKKSAEEVSPIETVWILDESGLNVLLLDAFDQFQGAQDVAVQFEHLEGDLKKVAATLGNTNPRDMIVHITNDESQYRITAMIPEGSEIGTSDAEDFLKDFRTVMEQSKLLSSGIPAEKLVYALSGVSSELVSAGEEEKSVGELLTSMILPMMIIFILYMMTLLYGQSITNVVSIEKASKLMETMLTMARPEAFLFGKILATVTVALLQLGLWLVCFVGGFFGGDLLAKSMIYSSYNNTILEVFEVMQAQEGSTAFSLGAILLFIVALCMGFLFFSVLAGFIASFASKTEEIAMCNAYYQIVVIAGFMGAYFLPLQEKDWINTILRFVPFTGAFLLPGDILVGNITVWQGMGYLIVLFLCIMVFVVAAGKAYKSQVFHKGMSVFERFQNKLPHKNANS